MGRGIGDAVLKEIAMRLKSIIGRKGSVGRVSGDEFLMIVPDAGEEDARDIATFLVEPCRQPFQIKNKHFALSCSIGVALSSCETPLTGEELLLNADLARDAAKKEGRNRFRFYHPEMRSQTESLHQLGHKLQQALTHDELLIYYQPQWNLMTNQLAGAEALVRWNHPRLGVLNPGQFLPAAETLGLLPKIDAYVFEHCIAKIVEMKQMGLDPRKVSINAESGILSMPGFANEVLHTLKQAGITNHNITIEILENTLVIENQTILENIKTLLRNDVNIALDDFGTDFSSLAQLKHLPVNILKIDRSIINNIENEARDHSILLSTINLAKSLKIDVVAEGMENKRQLRALKACGCKFVQGYLIARPMPYEDYQRYVEEHTRPSAIPSPLTDAA